MTSWTSKPTGDMTLSVLDEKGRQILKVDMLKYGVMRAGTNGDLLARTLNDLALIAALPDALATRQIDLDAILPHPDAGISPMPGPRTTTAEQGL